MTDNGPQQPRLHATARVEVEDVRKNRRNAALAVVASMASMILLPSIASALGGGSLAWLFGLAAVVSYFMSARSLAATDRGPGERSLVDGRITIDGDRLKIVEGSRETELPLSDLRGGWTEPTLDGFTAVLSFAKGQIVAVERPTEEEATAILTMAGAGPGARAVRMRTYREDVGGRKIAGALLAFFALLFVPMALAIPILLLVALISWSFPPVAAVVPFLVGGAPFALLCGWLWSKVRPTWIQIGTDGALVHGAFRDRFIRHASINQVAHTRGGIENAYHFVVIEVDGDFIRVPAATEREARVLIARLDAARKAAKAQERARLLDAIARDGRSPQEWKRALATAVAGSDYRTAGHDLEQMMRIVEDPEAPEEQRVAAAIAARPHGGEEVGQRIRFAAEACAAPKLRVALMSASSTGDVEDSLLEELEAESAQVR